MQTFLVYGLSNDWGGVEAIVMSMVQHLAGPCCFDIIQSERESSYELKYQSRYIHFVHIPTWGSNRREFSNSLKGLFKEKDYDYVWVNGCLMSNRTIISVTNKYSKAQIIAHSHGSSFEEGNILKRFVLLTMHKINRLYYKANVDFPCMCSEKSGLWFYGINYMQTHYVHHVKNGVDINLYRFNETIREKYRNELGLSDDFAIFHAGRLTEVKNQRRILSIFADFISTGVKAQLFIAGDGELLEELETHAKMLHIDNIVHFLGERNDVNNLYQAMDVLLLPSYHEGFPVTLTEAQASGLPCLVSDRVSEETNIVGLVKYLSIDSDSNEKWIAALKEIINNRCTDRNEYVSSFCDKGYDIHSVCHDFLHYIETKKN